MINLRTMSKVFARRCTYGSTFISETVGQSTIIKGAQLVVARREELIGVSIYYDNVFKDVCMNKRGKLEKNYYTELNKLAFTIFCQFSTVIHFVFFFFFYVYTLFYGLILIL